MEKAIVQPNKNPMAATWSKAAQVRKAFKGGRPRQKDLCYGAERSVLECRIIQLEIMDAMREAKIPTGAEDVKVALVCMDSSMVHLLPMPEKLEGLAAVYARAAYLADQESADFLGVAIWQRDREADSEDAWVQLWLVDCYPEALRARKAYAESRGEETSFKM